jgi:hypothetical protein
VAIQLSQRSVTLTLVLVLAAGAAQAANRTIDGSLNNYSYNERGKAGTPLIRIRYFTEYLNFQGAMIGDAQRANPRTISNALSAQSTGIASASARGLSDMSWVWAQFLDHDLSLSTSSAGAGVNGSAPIAVTAPGDPLGPNPIAFTRSNFVSFGDREQVNEVTAWIDGSQVYGSSADRAAALRTNNGAGAKLRTSANNLLPYNTNLLTNQNNGPTPAAQLFLAGDIRANENILLTSIQTVFMREHNRLVDRIATLQPSLSAEQQYQLARKLVGAEIQAITYNEFLPALIGSYAPKAEDYVYTPSLNGAVTNSFAHAAFRYGHSALPNSLALADSTGAISGSMSFAQALFNPNEITNNPALIDQALRGAMLQTSQEIDLKLSDSIRNVMFGPPGAGGTDLAAIDIQRGRDHGLPDYNEMRVSYGLPGFTNINQITSDVATRQALAALYSGNVNNIDMFIGALAEPHLPGSSLGALNTTIVADQFLRSRDGDRYFYMSDFADMYSGGVLRSEIAAIIDLDSVTLADVLMANTGLAALPENLFFAPQPGDFNGDGAVDGEDLDMWHSSFVTAHPMSGADFLTWQRNVASANSAAAGHAVPEPSALALAGLPLVAFARWRSRTAPARRRAS